MGTGALDFGGVSGRYIALKGPSPTSFNPRSLTDLTVGTIMCWSRLPSTDLTAESVMLALGTGGGVGSHEFRYNSNETMAFQVGRATTALLIVSTLADYPVFGANKWLFAAVRWDFNRADTDQNHYLGDEYRVPAEPTGAYSQQRAGTGTIESNAGTEKRISQGQSNRPALGLIAWVGCWNRWMRFEEIRHQWWRAHPSPGCVLFMKPGEHGSNRRIIDHSGYGNHGMLNGTPPVVVGLAENRLWSPEDELRAPAFVPLALAEKCPVSDLENLDGWTDEGGAGTDLWQSVDDLVTPSTFAQSPA